MSHTTTVKSVAIRDISALRAAVAELQSKGVRCELLEGPQVTPRMYYSGQSAELKGKTPFVLKLNDSPYDVGFQLMEDGTYAPVMDTFAGHIKKQIGAECGCSGKTEGESAAVAIGGLMQRYAKHAAINAAVAQGFSVEDVAYNEATGDVHLTIDASTYSGY